MLDQLLKIVQDSTQQAVVENDQIPNELNTQVQQEIAGSIESGLTSALSSCNIGGIMELFGSGAKQQNVSGNPIVNMINDQISKALSQKFNLSPAVANMIAASAVPAIMAKFTQKVADPQDNSIDMNRLVGGLLGGGGNAQPNQSQVGGLNFNDLLTDFATGKKSQSDLAGLAGQLLSGGQQKSGSGGLMGAIGKMLGQ